LTTTKADKAEILNGLKKGQEYGLCHSYHIRTAAKNVPIQDGPPLAPTHRLSASNWSVYSAMVRQRAYVRRFIAAILTGTIPKTSRLIPAELARAELTIIREAQKESFQRTLFELAADRQVRPKNALFKFSPGLDHQGVVRVFARLRSATWLAFAQSSPGHPRHHA
jgi:hypothetical protein